MESFDAFRCFPVKNASSFAWVCNTPLCIHCVRSKRHRGACICLDCSLSCCMHLVGHAPRQPSYTCLASFLRFYLPVWNVSPQKNAVRDAHFLHLPHALPACWRPSKCFSACPPTAGVQMLKSVAETPGAQVDGNGKT